MKEFSETTQYKVMNCLSNGFLLLFFIGIWVEPYRYRMILTAIFAFIILMAEYISREKKWKAKNEKE